MKNKLKQRENKGRGPLAKKVIDSARQQLQRKITGVNIFFYLNRNHRDDMILLEGFPDIRSSMPHAK